MATCRAVMVPRVLRCAAVGLRLKRRDDGKRTPDAVMTPRPAVIRLDGPGQEDRAQTGHAARIRSYRRWCITFMSLERCTVCSAGCNLWTPLAAERQAVNSEASRSTV